MSVAVIGCNGMCYNPQTFTKLNGKVLIPALTVKCGKCLTCLRQKSDAWADRMELEARYVGHENCVFLTLTYDDAVLDSRGEVLRLDMTHIQKFFKRFRKELDNYGNRIRYFYCGEYGTKTYRPHYHLLIFGISPQHPVFHWDIHRVVTKSGWSLRLKTWKYGFVNLSARVERGTFRYVCSYMMEDTPVRRKLLESMGLPPEFRRMSRNPGLGFFELKKNLIDTSISQ